MLTKYPEHEKLNKVKDLSQACGEFLTWLQDEKGLSLAIRCPEKHLEDLFYRSDVPTSRLLAEFFEIDEKKLEREKREMLEEIRAMSAPQEATS